MHQLRRDFVRNLLVYACAIVVRGLQTLIVLPAFSANVGPEGYGAFTQIMVVTSFLVPVVGFRLETAVVRMLSAESNSERIRQYFQSAFIWTAIIGAVTLLLSLSPDVANLTANLIFGTSDLAQLVSMLGLLLLVNLIELYLLSHFRIVNRMDVLSGILVIQAVLETGLVILAVTLGYGTEGAVLTMIAVETVITIGVFTVVQRQIGRLVFDWKSLQSMLRYSIPLMPNGATRWLVNYADRLIITNLLGLTAVGIYSASYSLAMSLQLLISPVGFVMFPILSRLWDEGEFREVQRYFAYVTRYFLFLAIPACVGLTILSPQLLRLIADESFVAGRWLIFWIASGILMNGVFQINVYVFHLVHRTIFSTSVLLLGATSNIALNLLLVPRLDIQGAAVSTAVTFLLMSLIALHYGQKFIGYRLAPIDIAKSAMASGLMGFVLYLLPIDNLILLIITTFTGGCIYLVLLLLTRAFTRIELLKLYHLLAPH